MKRIMIIVSFALCLTGFVEIVESRQLNNSYSSAIENSNLQDFEFSYHNYSESLEILKELNSEFPNLSKLYSIGKSETGTKDIWCLEITNSETGEGSVKPAAYFDANHHSSEVTGGEVTLYLAYYLLKNYGSDSDVTRLIDTRVIYIVHRADPDGAEAFITGKIDWDNEIVVRARDADNDGKKGEDGTDDIDGDGEILRIRIQDPEGQWKADPSDPRLMVRREDNDSTGTFYRVIDEGIDNDGDGRINEDPPFTRFISNRNYPAFWSSSDGRYRGEGDYPLQEHNARIVCDFILSKPNISMLESYHTTSGIHLRPYAARPDTDFPPQDLQDYSALLAKGTEITTYPVASVYNDFTTIDPNLPWEQQPGVRHGVFIDWTYVHLGIFSVTTELWTLEPFVNEMDWGDIPRDKPLFSIPGRYNRPDVQVQVMKWLDLNKNNPNLNGQGFINWKPFRHPTLGEVEIGGFTRYWLRNPPPGPFLQEVVEDQVEFAVFRALQTPLAIISDIKVERGDSGFWKVTATAVNNGYLDTSTEQARNARISQADRLSVTMPQNANTNDPATVRIPFMRGTRGSSFISKYKGTWNINAPEGTSITITLQSEKGGEDRKTIILR
ncbi:M14 family metallopeptidase [candidate division KSB1 bacterium]